MIKGIGVDMVELNSIKDLVNEKFIQDILSAEERKMYENIPVEATKLSFIGGRFAAKEALFKALKQEKFRGLYREFSILHKDNGAPYVVSDNLDPNLHIQMTISHTNHYTIAFVVIEYTK